MAVGEGGGITVHERRLLSTGAVWAIPAVVTLLAGLWRIGNPELWRDEVASWVAAERSPSQLYDMLQNVDASSGFYYFVLHYWIDLFGDSPTALRSLSALAMAGAAAFTALAARKLFRSDTAGLAAGLLFAVTPIVSRYAQEIRAYALVTCAAAAATWLLLRALERPTLARWTAFGAVTAIAGAAHLVSLAGLAGQAALVALAIWRPDALGPTRAEAAREAEAPQEAPAAQEAHPAQEQGQGQEQEQRDIAAPAERPARQVRWKLAWQFPLTAALAVAVLIPLMRLGQSQTGRQLGWLPHPDAGSLRHVAEDLFTSPRLVHLVAVLVLLAVLLPGRRLAALGTVLLAALPVLAVYQMSLGETSYFLNRYLLFVVPACVTAAGGGVGAVHRLLVRAFRGLAPGAAARTRLLMSAGLALVLLAGLSARCWYLVSDGQHVQRTAASHNVTDFEGAADLILAGHQPGDAMVAVSADYWWAMVGPSLNYYLRDAKSAPAQVFVYRTAIERDDLFPLETPTPQTAFGNHQRLWLINVDSGPDIYQGFTPQQTSAFKSTFTIARTERVTGLTVSLLVRSH
ncbi:glycosyltransferase family 39 protein [Kitasatospora sp. NPDC049285]|uniref:glycosyltransferase family 39 protein n=1 Tax=Kitasatospora sp. NPDC049285 TaxID=3157096 RepID=UPI0034240C00